MFNSAKLYAAFGLLLLTSQVTFADTKTTTSYECRKVVCDTRGGVERTTCPEGDKTCNVHLTLHDGGGFSSEVSESLVGAPIPIDPSEYIHGGGEMEMQAIIDRISLDLFSGRGVTTLR